MSTTRSSSPSPPAALSPSPQASLSPPGSPTGSAPLSDDDDDGLPEELTIQLNLRKLPALAAHNRKLNDLPDPPPWKHSCRRDSYHLLCARIRECIPTRLPGVRWPLDAQPYVKPSKHASAKLFQLLDEQNYLDALGRAYRMELKRGIRPDKILVHIFAYLQYPEARTVPAGTGGTGSTIQRATAPRKAAACQRIQQAVEQGQLTEPGPITQILLTQRLAQDVRLPDPDEPLQIPATATFVQAQHLDAQRAQYDKRRQEQEALDGATYKRIRIRIQDAVHTLDVDVESLRIALNLPHYGLDGLGRLQQVDLPRPQEDMDDVDHADSD